MNRLIKTCYTELYINSKDMERAHIIGISGSLRTQSYNTRILQYMQRQDIFDIQIVPLIDIPMFNEDIENELPNAVAHLRDSIKQAQGVIIATPEYNWSLPAATKNAIDWLSTNTYRNGWKDIPVAICGASNGYFGTIRSQMQLRPILIHLEARVMNSPNLFISDVTHKVATDGSITDAHLQEEIAVFLLSFNTFIG